MVLETMSHIFRKLKRKKSADKANENGYVAPKPARRWERRKRQEEKMDREKKEHITQTKVSPWLQLCGDPRERQAMALYSLSGDEKSGELDVKQGDRLTIESINRSDVWLEVYNDRTNKFGYLPRNFITEETGIDDVLDAWFDIDRRNSEYKLLMADHPSGTYLLRPSSNPFRIVLSVLSVVGSKRTVKHFMIKYNRITNGYYIGPKKTFNNLKDLIDHYKKSELSDPLPRYPPAIQSRQFWIPANKIDLKSHLSKGGRFGSVYRAIFRAATQKTIVIKKLSTIENPDLIIKCARDCHKLQNPALVQFLGLSMTSPTESYLLVWEYMPGGNLKDYLVNNHSDIKYSKLQRWLHQVLDGMDYLESAEFFHGELKADNVFLSHDLCVKVGNFGFNVYFGRSIDLAPELSKTEAVRWTAPEAMEPDHIFDIRSDVWSFGVLMFEVFTYGSKPYAEIDTRDVPERVKSGYRLPDPRDLGFDCEYTMYDTMKSCWFIDTTDRPTFRELWFTFDDNIPKNTEYADFD